ncbi:MAG: class I SAM-dependent methyltransferase [Bacteroidales bacterium]|nr:class I SAM-dependent methyltransferase [Bacteroidales bacterium]
MQEEVLRVGYYLRFLAKAGHRKGRGINSPFAYRLAEQVIGNNNPHPAYPKILEVYNMLGNSDERLIIKELGGGSRTFRDPERQVSSMLKNSSVSLKYGHLLCRLADFLKPSYTLELGTSIGMSTICLALGNPEGKVVSLEGNPSLCSFSKNLFEQQGLNNIEVREGLFDDLLPEVLLSHPSPGLVYIDGNHRHEPTLRYFVLIVATMKTGLIIFDDIHWSQEMNRAWQRIKSDSRTIFSMDLFRMGLICIDPSLTPGHYIMRF